MNLESNKISVKKSQKELFEFLTKLENYEQLMPENIQKFEVDGESFIFGLKGMPEIRLVLKEKVEFDKVILGAASSKLPFTLTANIIESSEDTADAQMLFEGDFNPMMAMMIKSPLQKFIDTLSQNISKL
ncbi:orotate phosphoribosyltransferase [Urechidicola croceus]|uniref:Orotate phosphoribosyltransferase n=1 Tax=Urechidicola croceus TaxID=1850246 RepID=A0A1D8PBC8_9FLAO|nr:orotate phosphoribosyltransferase [Urechidicola croceus]AOW21879.1 orotate phosphoribosyltransferase [Urechidicola croceus]